ILIWEIENISPSGKMSVATWLNSDLTLAQRRSLTPGTVKEITGSVERRLTLQRDEFETSQEYNARVDKLADWTLMKLQAEMEKQYKVRSKSGKVEIPLQGLVGYNADLQIYKIRFMETEAGVAIPISSAKKFKDQWSKAHIRAQKMRNGDRGSYRYSSFELYNPADKKYYPVTPLENPFHPEQQQETETERGEVMLPKDTISGGGIGTTYALMFASNVYDYYSDLVNPVLDAQTIGAELSESYGVVSEVVINPTLSETAAIIREFATRTYKPEDNLMVFFAGHGVYDEVFREGYVISRDSRMDDVGKTSYLSHSNLRTMINNIDCPHIFLVMDVCFGGTFDPHLASLHRGASATYADISTQDFVERKLKYKTRLYLTSGGKEYVPDGRPGFHSPFARRFIESLRYYGGDDGVLTTAEILQFVEKVNPQPRFGEFGDNEPGSDFILVVK
ncbi:MAG: caspase family protein, partial [Bacteroidales bacterium]|nr:caspase family protein [Bacteroidales bacterium]